MNRSAGSSQRQSSSKTGLRGPTRFLVAGFVALALLSVIAFSVMSSYIGRRSEEAISQVGDLYMAGIREQISRHFETIIELRLQQLDEVLAVVDPSAPEEILRAELAYRSEVRDFSTLALCSEDGVFDAIYGLPLTVTDPAPFFQSIRDRKEKVAVGRDSEGNELVLLALPAVYSMTGGCQSAAIVAAFPVSFVKDALSLEQENALLSSYIIRQDGSFVIHPDKAVCASYFDQIRWEHGENDRQAIESYITELSAAMESGRDHSVIISLSDMRRQVYCMPLSHSEWFLVTVLPYGALNDALNTLEVQRFVMGLGACTVVLILIVLVFLRYLSITRQQMAQLEEARRTAVEATRAKSEFLSNMSHDIRTPMNAIVGMTAIAAAHIDDREQVQNCLKKITLSSKHLLGLINDVLDMSKIESGKMTLTMDKISLREVIESLVSIVQPQVLAKGQTFHVQIDRIAVEDVYCDSVRLNQVLLNLLSNAVKYTPEGGNIQLYLCEESSPRGDGFVRIHVRVKDNGIGMSPEFLTKIFDSYSRADSARVRKTEGAGLGMAITKYIVDAMDGQILVESQLGEGSEFRLILDLEKAPTEETDMVLPPWRMLVVDDDELLCRTAVEALTSIGLKADSTLCGESAIQMALDRHRQREDYQIILLDWKLPGMDGIQVARELRRQLGNDIPIVLISAYDWSELEAEAREAGVNGFISKPLFKSTLFYGLRQYMNLNAGGTVASGQPADLNGRRILLAEDNDLNWEIASELLSGRGLTLEWAQNGQICLEKFQQSQPGFYDAILMDIRMPVMTGYDATRAIRALDRPDAKTIPIIAMTADAFSEDIQHCLDCGMNAHVAKPIRLDELSHLLEKFLL